MFKVGIIGLGNMGKMHLLNCLKLENVTVIGVADPSLKSRKQAKTMGIREICKDYNELFKGSNDLDAVIVSIPNFLHAEAIKAALENGINVLTEKPLAISVEECMDIERWVAKSGRKLMVGHNMRFVEAVEEMKRKLEKGVIGRFEVATIEEVVNGPFAHPAVPVPVADWWFDKKTSGGGALIDIGYHMIDLFRFFTQENARVIFSDLGHKFNLPVEERATVILSSLNSQIRGIINVGWYQRSVFPRYNFRAILHGTSDYLTTEEIVPRNIYLHAMKEGTKNFLRKIGRRKIRPLSYTYYFESYFKELQAFFNCLKNDSEPPVSADDGVKTVEIIQQAYAFSEKMWGA